MEIIHDVRDISMFVSFFSKATVTLAKDQRNYFDLKKA